MADWNELLPATRAALESIVSAKAALDSSELAMVNNLSVVLNKIRLLEEKAAYIDSTNFEILSQLVLIENKIVSLTASFIEISAVRATGSTPGEATRITDAEYQKRYIDALASYQNGQYDQAIRRFSDLVSVNPGHNLADNAQYWIGESYYATKNFRRAIGEFEKVLVYSNSNKDDDAQYKLALCYWNVGNHEKARTEFQRLLDRFQNSEFAPKARRFIQ